MAVPTWHARTLPRVVGTAYGVTPLRRTWQSGTRVPSEPVPNAPVPTTAPAGTGCVSEGSTEAVKCPEVTISRSSHFKEHLEGCLQRKREIRSSGKGLSQELPTGVLQGYVTFPQTKNLRTFSKLSIKFFWC